MSEIRIRVDIDRLTLDDAIFLEDYKDRLPPRFVKQLLAKVIVDDQDNPLPIEDALKVVGGLTIEETRAALLEFRMQLAKKRQDTIPPGNSGS